MTFYVSFPDKETQHVCAISTSRWAVLVVYCTVKPFSSLSRPTFVQAVSQVSETSLNRVVNPKNLITVHNVVLHKMLICKGTRWY